MKHIEFGWIPIVAFLAVITRLKRIHALLAAGFPSAREFDYKQQATPARTCDPTEGIFNN